MFILPFLLCCISPIISVSGVLWFKFTYSVHWWKLVSKPPFFCWKMCHHVLASDVWGFVYACRSTIWTGEILGFPEIRKGEESARWPQAPGIPQQIQDHWWFQSRCKYKHQSYMLMWSQNNTLTLQKPYIQNSSYIFFFFSEMEQLFLNQKSNLKLTCVFYV